MSSTESKWAILIGIDFYPKPRNGDGDEMTLGGCVHDVERMSEYLCGSLGFRPNNVTRLLSSRPEDMTKDEPAGNDPSVWPSYENIMRSINSVLRKSRPGDIVYIHFSGIISDVPTILPQFRERRPDDKALMLFNDVLDRKFLHDLELAALLHRLVIKGLEVAVVLDGRWSYTSSTPVEQSDFSQEELALMYHGIWTKRGQDTRLQNPDPRFPHTLLSSSYFDGWRGSTEYKAPEAEQRHGFLTYWMLKVLKEDGPSITYRSLFRKIWLKTKDLLKEQPQTTPFPVFLAGKMDEIFLGGEKCLSSSIPYDGFANALDGVALSSITPLELGEAGLLARQLPLLQPFSLSTRANFYRSRLRARSKLTSFSEHIEFVVVGGYRHQQPGDSPIRSPTFTLDGCLHLMSGDYVTIHFRNQGNEPLFINILCFDSSFGINQVYPMTNDNIPHLGKRGDQDELSLDLRLSLPIQHMRDPKLTRATEVLKIFATNQFTSFESLELPAIRDEIFLTKYLDPAAFVLSTRCDDDYPSSDPHNFKKVDNGNSGAGSQGDREDEEVSDEKWCCFDAKFIIHRTAESLAVVGFES
jgi:hypothetical protein